MDIITEKNDDEFVTLVSSDGYSFVLQKKIASISSVIKNIFSFEEKTGEIQLDIYGDVLECIIEYLHYNYKYSKCEEIESIPEFDVPVHLVLELLVKADFLDL